MARTPHPDISSEIRVRKAYGRLGFRMVLRLFAYVVLALAVAALAYDAWVWRGVGDFVMRSGADWWASLHEDSYTAFTDFVRRSSDWAWDNVVNRALRWPACATMGGLGAITWMMGRRRHHI